MSEKKPKKKAPEQTTDEAIRRVFPSEVVRELEKQASEDENDDSIEEEPTP